MIYKKLFLSLVFVLAILLVYFPLTGAENLGVYQINREVELIQICSNDTSLCDYCNITSVKYPNSSVLISDVVMTKRTSDFNYSLTGQQVTEVGDYLVNGFCGSGNELEVWSYKFTTTRTGDALDTSEGLIIVVFLIGSLTVFFITLYGAIKIKWQHKRNVEGEIISINDLRYVKVFLMAMVYLEALMIVGLLRGVTANFLVINGVSSFFNYLYWILFSFLYPIIVGGIFLTLILFLDNKKLKKKLLRGIRLK